MPYISNTMKAKEAEIIVITFKRLLIFGIFFSPIAFPTYVVIGIAIPMGKMKNISSIFPKLNKAENSSF